MFLAERLSNLQRSTSLTRKFLKLGLAESFARLLVKVGLREQMGWRKVLAMGRLAGMAMYGFWNYPVWACKVGLVKLSHKVYTARGLKSVVHHSPLILFASVRGLQRPWLRLTSYPSVRVFCVWVAQGLPVVGGLPDDLGRRPVGPKLPISRPPFPV